jgi:hypothetical protein
MVFASQQTNNFSGYFWQSIVSQFFLTDGNKALIPKTVCKTGIAKGVF